MYKYLLIVKELIHIIPFILNILKLINYETAHIE